MKKDDIHFDIGYADNVVGIWLPPEDVTPNYQRGDESLTISNYHIRFNKDKFEQLIRDYVKHEGMVFNDDNMESSNGKK